MWLGYYIPVSGSSSYSLTCATATVAGAASCNLDLPAGLIGPNESGCIFFCNFSYVLLFVVIVTTFAGSGAGATTNGVGTAASFSSPWGVCVASNGAVYVTDNSGYTLRLISTSGCIVLYVIS